MNNIIIKKSSEYSYWLAWFCCSISLFYIGKDRLINAHLWAEDGKFFLEYALLYGPSAIFQEYSGYYHVIPHLIAQILVNTVSVYFIPVSIVLITYLIYATAFAQFVKNEYRHYIDSDLVRLALALTGCLWLSGRVEVLGNLANLHWVLFLYLWLIAMRPAVYPVKFWEVILIVFCVFSAGEAVLITPLLLLRIYQSWNANNNTSHVLSHHKNDIIILFVIALSVILNLLNTLEFSSSLPTQQPVINWQEFFEGLQRVFLLSMFVYPWLGSGDYQHYYQLLNQNHFLIPILLAFLLLLIIVFLQVLLYKKKYRNLQAVMGILCLLTLPVLTWLVRPQSLSHYNHNIFFSEWWGARYTFVLGLIGLFFWAIFLYRVFSYINRSLATVIVFLFVGIYAYQHLAMTEIKAYGTQYDWQESAALLHQSTTSGCPKEVVIPIYPEGWKMTYLSDSDKICP